jgi:hypothetical protein
VSNQPSPGVAPIEVLLEWEGCALNGATTADGQPANPDLLAFVKRLASLISELGGELAEYPGDKRRYKAAFHGRNILWLRLIGENPRTNPPNSVQLFTKWHEDFQGVGARQGNYWSGEVSADLVAEANDPRQVARAEEFIRLAFRRYA